MTACVFLNDGYILFWIKIIYKIVFRDSTAHTLTILFPTPSPQKIEYMIFPDFVANSGCKNNLEDIYGMPKFGKF